MERKQSLTNILFEIPIVYKQDQDHHHQWSQVNEMNLLLLFSNFSPDLQNRFGALHVQFRKPWYHNELMKVKVSIKIMIKIGNGLLFSLPVGDKPRGVKEMKQFVFKFLQDYFCVPRS